MSPIMKKLNNFGDYSGRYLKCSSRLGWMSHREPDIRETSGSTRESHPQAIRQRKSTALPNLASRNTKTRAQHIEPVVLVLVAMLLLVVAGRQ